MPELSIPRGWGEVLGHLLCDSHEPLDAGRAAVMLAAVPVLIRPLNDEGYADYLWPGADGWHQWERKQVGELAAGLDSVEDQLRREAQAHPEVKLGLLVEGVATPSAFGTQIWSKPRGTGRDVWYKGREQTLRYAMIAAWLYQIGKFVEVVHTADYMSTCATLVAMYQSDQKENHTTMERYLKPITWRPNKQVESLIAIGHGVGIGAAKAEALIKKHGTIYNILMADPKVLATTDGIGKVLATRLLRSVGRPDV